MSVIYVTGYLGVKPEVRYTPESKKVIKLRIAAHVHCGGENKTIWWDVLVTGEHWERLWCEKYFQVQYTLFDRPFILQK